MTVGRFGSFGSSYGLGRLGAWAPSSGMVSAAEQAVAYAKSGKPLSSYTAAENASRGFYTAAQDTAYAYLLGAFWLAAASRLLRKPSLASQADSLLSSGKWRTSFHTVASEDPIDIQAIISDVVNTIRDAGGGSKTAGILSILGSTSSTENVQQAQRVESSKSLVTQAGVQVQTMAQQIAQGQLPVPPSAIPSWMKTKWFPFVAGGAILLFLFAVGAVAARPYAKLAREAYGDAKRSVSAALPARTNRRRRNRRRRR